jgi:putative lipoic acid-binding regulatory protein
MGQKPLPPKIEFPCDDYPIKVLGDSAEDYLDFVVACVSEHTDRINSDFTTVQASRNGRFTSVTLFITATGAEQLEAIHQALKLSGRVKMVL